VTVDPLNLRELVSPHFSWSELTTTQNRDPGIVVMQENPPELIRTNLLRLARTLLEPAHDLVGRLQVNSGYRCAQLNAALPGSSKTSAHMLGLAADLVPLEQGLVEAFEAIAAAHLPALDQLIFEFGRWAHLGAAPLGRAPRGQLLMIFTGGKYELWNPQDERVTALREVVT
jgi:hypothetical protein